MNFPNKLNFAVRISILFGFNVAAGQNADVPPPESRLATVNRISRAAETRSKPYKAPEILISPFTGVVKEIEPLADFSNVPVPVGLSGPELISQLAQKIPSTATVVFGGNSFLMMGAKKAKVGEKIVVNHDGKDYQLTLKAVTTTTFTVQLGSDVSTRPIRKR